MSFRTTVIPVAGLGTRFLPATKAVPKELLPVIDRPLIEYAVREAVAAGSRHVVLVSAPAKTMILEHFAADAELEAALAERGKDSELAVVREASRLAEVEAVIQHRPLGVGHAILQAREAVGEQPFAVMFPDDFVIADVPVLEQLRRVHEERGGIVLAVERVPRDRLQRYGVIDGEEVAPGVYRVADLVEKPDPASAPSDLGVVGRYVLPAEIFDILDTTEAGVGGEIQITDAIREAARAMPCHAVCFAGRRHDCGSRLGLIEATIDLARRDPELRDDLERFLADR